MKVEIRSRKRLSLVAALALVIVTFSVAYALEPDGTQIVNPPNTDQQKFGFNPASGDLGLAANEAAFQLNGIIFEGATADENETRFSITDPTAERTITFPDASGTVSLIGATETLLNKTLTTPTIGDFSSATHDHEDNSGGGVLAGYLRSAADDTYGGASARTLTIDNSKIDLDGGGNGEGSLELPHSTTLPASCAIGEIYIDEDADTDGAAYFCHAVDTWKLLGGSGGGQTCIRQFINSPMKVELLASGKQYLALGGRICDDEASCRTSFEDADTVNFLDCSMSENQGAGDVVLTLDVDNCEGAGWTFNGSAVTIPATKQQTGDGSDAASTGGADKCANIEIENTDGSNPTTRAYLNCSYLYCTSAS